ncbi:hypothetical protein HMPREF9134_00057 [Porphyromonas catoniae F0037]|uniref:Uncharacterized protein n=1 Tax=Porphyromonas catoniae F0037 TaxID=1127696 RepID=L1NJ84_9PORP|nr:hypothetical protein HMPREF9134_00057 [Porphyromonas catoniae F0037]
MLSKTDSKERDFPIPYLSTILCHKAFCIFAGQEKSLFSRRITSQQQAEATCPAQSPKI